jgi:hypothetical protein
MPYVEELLDEALMNTFPASDPVALQGAGIVSVQTSGLIAIKPPIFQRQPDAVEKVTRDNGRIMIPSP